jgi:hypothetical protein
MLRAGIITWISMVLKDTDSLSDYTLEYASQLYFATTYQRSFQLVGTRWRR